MLIIEYGSYNTYYISAIDEDNDYLYYYQEDFRDNFSDSDSDDDATDRKCPRRRYRRRLQGEEVQSEGEGDVEPFDEDENWRPWLECPSCIDPSNVKSQEGKFEQTLTITNQFDSTATKCRFSPLDVGVTDLYEAVTSRKTFAFIPEGNN